MNAADLYVRVLTEDADNPDAGDEYVWGAAGEADRDHDGHTEADCSGEHHKALVAAGYHDVRTTADGYMHRADMKLPAPSEPGDMGFLLRADGTAHHIVNYVGPHAHGDIVEAKGAAYGIVWSTVAGLNERGAVWKRDSRVRMFLGDVTPPEPMLHSRIWFVTDAGNDAAWKMTQYAAALGCIVVSGRFGTPQRVAWLTEARETAAVRIVDKARSLGLTVNSRKVNKTTESMKLMLARVKAGTM